MIQFIKKLVVFWSILAVYFTVMMSVNYYFYTHQPPIKSLANILIAGDSHPETSINPSYFQSARNISQSTEPYFITYWKLKTIFNYYQPDTLILGFAPHNLSSFNDYKLQDPSRADELFKRIYPIAQLSHLKSQIPIDYFRYYKMLWKKTAFFPKLTHYGYLGQFGWHTQSDLSDVESAIQRHYYVGEELAAVSAVSIQYLDSIVSLCREKNIHPILTANPVNYRYYRRIPKQFLKQYEIVKAKYEQEATLVDCLKADYEDSLFLNADHLNAAGAAVFTEKLRKSVQLTH